jgi:hypothetical protein
MGKQGVFTAHHTRKNNGYNTIRNSTERPNKGPQFTTLSMDSESFIYSVVMEIQQGD